MKAEDLKVGMIVYHKFVNCVYYQKITAIGEGSFLCKDISKTDFTDVSVEYRVNKKDLSEFHLVKQKKKVTLFRYTMSVNHLIKQSIWTTQSPMMFCGKLLKTESKEIEVDD